MRRCPSSIAFLVAVGLVACSDDTPPAAFAPAPCEVRPAVDNAALEQMTEADIRAAVLDAAERLAPALTDRERAADLRAALRSLHATDGAHASDVACRAIRIARDLLEEHTDSPESGPDRSAIRLALDLAETHYARAR